MHGKLLSTNDVCQRQRFAYWQDLICDAIVNLDCSAPEPANFTGSIHVHDLGNLRLSTMVSDQMSLFRSPQRISRAREDCLGGNLLGRGKSAVANETDSSDPIPSSTAAGCQGREHESNR